VGVLEHNLAESSARVDLVENDLASLELKWESWWMTWLTLWLRWESWIMIWPMQWWLVDC